MREQWAYVAFTLQSQFGRLASRTYRTAHRVMPEVKHADLYEISRLCDDTKGGINSGAFTRELKV